jgi:hypothetical protein
LPDKNKEVILEKIINNRNMLNKIKDLSKIVLNNNDLMIKQITVKKASNSGLILSETMSKEDLQKFEEVENVIVAKGAKVEEFEIGDIVSLRSLHGNVAFDTLDNTPNADKYFVVGQHAIEYTVRPDNYEK